MGLLRVIIIVFNALWVRVRIQDDVLQCGCVQD